MKGLSKKSLFLVRRILSKYPKFFFIAYSLKPHYRRNLLTRAETDLVIEGYPRSANTHCVVVAEKFFPSLQIAHHMHSEAQISAAIDAKKPVLVVIRDPLNSVSSLVLREKGLSIKDCLVYYIEFHEFVLKNKNSIKVMRFEDVLESRESVISLISEMVGVSPVRQGEFSEEEYRKYISSLNQRDNGGEFSVSLPSDKKEKAKASVIKKINHHSDLGNLIEKANKIYDSLV